MKNNDELVVEMSVMNVVVEVKVEMEGKLLCDMSLVVAKNTSPVLMIE